MMASPPRILRLAGRTVTAVCLFGTIFHEMAVAQDVGRTPARLTAPARDDISNPSTNAVVLVGGGCSGTLIAPTLVITAAHCLSGPIGGESSVWSDQRAVWRPFTLPPFRNDDCCVSALRSRPPEENRDLPGWDMSSLTLAQADHQLCRAACDSTTGCQAWTYVRPGRQGPNARCYLKRAGIAVSIGNDQRAPIARGHSRSYSMAGLSDIAMLRLDQAVPASAARPAPVLTLLPRADAPAEWLRRQSYVFAGWGGGRPIRRTAPAAFAEFPGRLG